MKNLIYLSFLFLVVGCNGQDKNTSPVIEKEQEEKIAITDSIVLNINNPNVTKWKGAEKFSNQNLINNKMREEEFVVGDTIIQHLAGVYFYETKFISGSPFKSEKRFHKKTLNLIQEGNYFYNAEIGIHKIYNAEGKLIKEIDTDAQYPISMTEFIDIIKSKCNVDLNKEMKRTFIKRYIETKTQKPQYRVQFPAKENTISPVRNIIVNAETREILSDKMEYLKD